eukprot:621575-Amphidinium_carterae.1
MSQTQTARALPRHNCAGILDATHVPRLTSSGQRTDHHWLQREIQSMHPVRSSGADMQERFVTCEVENPSSTTQGPKKHNGLAKEPLSSPKLLNLGYDRRTTNTHK